MDFLMEIVCLLNWTRWIRMSFWIKVIKTGMNVCIEIEIDEGEFKNMEITRVKSW